MKVDSQYIGYQNYRNLFFRSLLVIFTIFGNSAYASTSPTISIDAMAPGEIQPRLLRDARGLVHLIYFKIQKPESKMGNLFYRQYQSKNNQWSDPVQVSTQAYRLPDVIASAKFAVDNDGRVHVSWLRSRPAGYMYSRSNTQGNKFEAERSLVTKNMGGAEVSAAIAVNKNRVTMSWLAGGSEPSSTIYTMTSTDSGNNFGEEELSGDQSLGGCGCCGLASLFNNKGELTVAYRSAIKGSGRHMQLLTLSTKKTTSKVASNTRQIHPWEYNACPVTTNNLCQDNKGNSWLVFETTGRIYIADLQQSSSKPISVRQPKQKKRQKHPAITFNDSGYSVVVWGEADGFFSGGELQIQLFDPKGNSVDSPMTMGMKSANLGNAAVVSLPDGSFKVLY